MRDTFGLVVRHIRWILNGKKIQNQAERNVEAIPGYKLHQHYTLTYNCEFSFEIDAWIHCWHAIPSEICIVFAILILDFTRFKFKHHSHCWLLWNEKLTTANTNKYVQSISCICAIHNGMYYCVDNISFKDFLPKRTLWLPQCPHVM